MTRHKWKLTQPVDGQPEIDPFDDDGPYVLGGDQFDLLAEIAREPGSDLIEIRPGLYSSSPWVELPPEPEG